MLECNACIRRCTRFILADYLNTHPPPRRLPWTKPTTQSIRQYRRGYATQTIQSDDFPTPSPSLDVGFRRQYVPIRSPPQQHDEPFSKTSLEQEVRWLRDPLKLGDHVVTLLRQDKCQKALALVRVASKTIECTVSWNYLIDFFMSKARVADAVKLYNEVYLCSLAKIELEKVRRLTVATDEKARPTARCTHLHHSFSRLFMAPQILTLRLPCPLCIPLYVCRQFPR